jgi:hypothetical protein
MPALPALTRQHGPNLIDSFGWRERTMRSAVTRLAACFALALLPSAPFAGLARQSIGGRRLGGGGGVLKTQRQLPFQIGDSSFGFGDPLLFLGELLSLLAELLPQLLHLAMQALVLAA